MVEPSNAHTAAGDTARLITMREPAEPSRAEPRAGQSNKTIRRQQWPPMGAFILAARADRAKSFR